MLLFLTVVVVLGLACWLGEFLADLYILIAVIAAIVNLI
jgi:hypothetical protein